MKSVLLIARKLRKTIGALIGLISLVATSPVAAADGVVTKPPLITTVDPVNGPLKPQLSDASLINSFERSEVGDIVPLREVRDSVQDPGIRAGLDARLAASLFDLVKVRAADARMKKANAPLRWRAIELVTRAGAEFAAGNYAEATANCEAWLALPAGTDPIHSRSDIEQMGSVAGQLANLPRQHLEHFKIGSTRTWRDKATLIRTTVALNDKHQEVVLDTGANLSVVSASTARALGLRSVGGSSVRSSSRSAVKVRLAIADRLEISGSAFQNVAFLVLNDADLKVPLPGGYDIPAIIGFPVLRALGRITFASDAFRVERPLRRRTESANLSASGSDLFVHARVNDFDVPLHVDTGASNTSLGSRFAVAHPELVGTLEQRPTRSAGAGGTVESTASILKEAVVKIGGTTIILHSVEIANSKAATAGNFGTLGQDVLRSAARYTIDFDRMTLTLTGKRTAASNSPKDANAGDSGSRIGQLLELVAQIP